MARSAASSSTVQDCQATRPCRACGCSLDRMSSCRSRPCHVQRPSRTRLGHGRRTDPAGAAGDGTGGVAVEHLPVADDEAAQSAAAEVDRQPGVARPRSTTSVGSVAGHAVMGPPGIGALPVTPSQPRAPRSPSGSARAGSSEMRTSPAAKRASSSSATSAASCSRVLGQADPPGPGAGPVVQVGAHPRPDGLHLPEEHGRAGRADALDLLQQAARRPDVAVGLLGQPAEIAAVPVEHELRHVPELGRGAFVVAAVPAAAEGLDHGPTGRPRACAAGWSSRRRAVPRRSRRRCPLRSAPTAAGPGRGAGTAAPARPSAGCRPRRRRWCRTGRGRRGRSPGLRSRAHSYPTRRSSSPPVRTPDPVDDGKFVHSPADLRVSVTPRRLVFAHTFDSTRWSGGGG